MFALIPCLVSYFFIWRVPDFGEKKGGYSIASLKILTPPSTFPACRGERARRILHFAVLVLFHVLFGVLLPGWSSLPHTLPHRSLQMYQVPYTSLTMHVSSEPKV